MRNPKLFLCYFLFLSPPTLAGQWEIELESENTFNKNGDRESAIEPTISYSFDHWKTHIEYEKPVSPEDQDGNIEWQLDYKFHNSNKNIKFSIRNEVDRDLNRDRTSSEITPRWFYKTSKSLSIGFELELDYYDSSADSEFNLFEAELEPTIIWTRKNNSSVFSAELEAPVLRLYSDKEGSDDFEYEGVEAILKYTRKLN